MRKIILLFALMLSVVFVNAQNTSATFNLSMTVDKYIEVMPSPVNWDIGVTDHNNYQATEEIYGVFNEWDLAYANCEFNITINGSNDAQEPYPRFARRQQGPNGNGFWDTLPTLYDIHIITNGESNHVDGAGTTYQESGSFPLSENFDEAPHNGQIKMNMRVDVNTTWATDPGVQVRRTLINSAFTDAQSADAGEYKCNMVVTLTAI